MNAIPRQLETGKQGLTRQCRDLLKILEMRYGICWWRNNPILKGSDGRPDFEIIWENPGYDMVFIGLELKSAKGKLNHKQLREKDRIERAGGIYFVCRSIYEVADIFKRLGMEVDIQ
jgi:hypothetical protein